MRLTETQGIIKYGGWYNLIKVLGLIWTKRRCFGTDKVKVFGNRNFLEIFNLFWFWVPKKLKLNRLAKRIGSKSIKKRLALLPKVLIEI